MCSIRSKRARNQSLSPSIRRVRRGCAPMWGVWRSLLCVGLAFFLFAVAAAPDGSGVDGASSSRTAPTADVRSLLPDAAGGSDTDDRAIFGSMKEMLLGSLSSGGSSGRPSRLRGNRTERVPGRRGGVAGGAGDRGGGDRGTRGRRGGPAVSVFGAAGASRGGGSDPADRGAGAGAGADAGTYTGNGAVARTRTEQAAKAAHHRAAYRSSCYLRTDSRRFGLPPANYARSDAQRLLYFEVPKAASTAVRQILHKQLGGSKELVRGAYRLNATELAYFKFTFVRDPVDRFVSNFNFLTVFSPHLAPDRRSTETAKVAARRWVDELYTRGWWNWHLWPQGLYLSMPDGSPRAVDLVYTMDSMQEGFDIVARHGASVAVARRAGRNDHVETDVIAPFNGRYSQEKVLHTSDLDTETEVRLCRVYLSDFCCFGLDMPDVCVAAASKAVKGAGTAAFNSTEAVCASVEVSALWAGDAADRASGPAASNVGGFFDPLPEPQRAPHMYAGANKVVESYHTFMRKMVH